MCIWGYENTDILERIHTDFLRKITNSRKSTPLYMLYAELGRHPISIDIKCRMIKFWNKIILSKQTKLSYISYQIMRHYNNHQFKWITSIKNILNNTGNPDLWLNQNNITTNNIDKLIKQNLLDTFNQNWNSKLQTSSKGKNYSLLKDNVNIEYYIQNLPKYAYLPLLKLRSSNTYFAVERGRWSNNHVPYNERKCTLCNLNELGDAFHYVLICPYFNIKRKQLIKPYYITNPNIIKYKQLFNTKSTDILFKLSTFAKILLKNVR